jgi:HTH-type transcriptional regulator, competence development regulator
MRERRGPRQEVFSGLGKDAGRNFSLAKSCRRTHASQTMAKKEVPLYKQKPKPRFGEWLRELRQQKNLALREVAAAVGMDQAHLSKAELGQRLPTEEQVRVLAEFFRIKPAEMEARRLAEKLIRELEDSPAGAAAFNILREESPVFS